MRRCSSPLTGLVHASHGGASTRFGLAIYIGSAVAATGAAAAAIAVTDRSAAPFAVVLAVAVLPVPTVAGHALDPGRSWLEVPIDLLHVIAAAVWIGGLFALAFVVPREGVSAEVIGAAARRFSSLALASVIVVALTGAVRALAELSAVSQLWTTGYGRAILVKTGLFAVLLGLGSLSRARVAAGVERLRTVVLAEVDDPAAGRRRGGRAADVAPARSSLDLRAGTTHKLGGVRRLRWGLLILPLLVLAPPIKRAASDPYPTALAAADRSRGAGISRSPPTIPSSATGRFSRQSARTATATATSSTSASS